MATFVFVHGSFQASWCWHDVVSQIETSGHRAVTFDLPGHGTDATPLEHVTMQHYVDAVLRVARAQAEPVILVGHSMGGVPIAAAAESDPSVAAALVFVAGMLPPNGVSLLDSVQGFDPAYLAEAIWAADRRTVRMSPAGARGFLYPFAPAELVEQTIPLMTAEPMAPYETPVHTTAERFGRVPSYYIETTRDRIVPLAMQKSFQERIGCRAVFPLDSDHSPFFSMPTELVACLTSIAADLRSVPRAGLAQRLW